MPYFWFFYSSGGNEAILKTSNFAPYEFRKLHSIEQSQVIFSRNAGGGKRSNFEPLDVLFMSLVGLDETRSRS